MRGSAVRSARTLLQGNSAELGQLAERLASGSLASASSAATAAAASAGFSGKDLRSLRTLARGYRQLLEQAFGSEGSALQQVFHVPRVPACSILFERYSAGRDRRWWSAGKGRAVCPARQRAEAVLQLRAS